MCNIYIYIYIYIYTDIHIFVRAFHSVLQISFILHHKAIYIYIYIFKQPINNIFAIPFFILEYIMIMCEISRPCASNFNGGSMT